MREQGKLVMMSALLTVLVWVAADQLLSESAALQAVIKPVPASAGTISLRQQDGDSDTFRLVVSGPRRIVERLKEMQPLSVTAAVAATGTGSGEVELLGALDQEKGPLAGLTLVSVVPETLRFIADRDVTLKAPIEVDPGSLDYDVKPTVEPASVLVTLSEMALAGVPEDQRKIVLRAEAHLRSRPLGALLNFDVPLEAKLGGVEARLSPSQVRLSATLREQRAAATIAAVPVRFEGSADLLNEFRIELRDPVALLTQSVPVKGPPDTIARLKSGDMKITGVISLTRAGALDSAPFQFQKPVFHLPPGVELDDPAAISGVEFRLIRNRPAAP